MPLEFVPTLARQLEVYRVPRSPERFAAYLAATIGEAQHVALLPLVSANPMAQEHLNIALETWLTLGVDEAARGYLQELEPELSLAADYRVGLTVLDDLKGGWTNRFLNDSGFRFPKKILTDWIVVPLWVSEAPSLAALRVAVRLAVARAYFQARHGLPKTLLEMLAQEGFVQFTAGVQPTLSPDDLEYSRAVIQPLLGTLQTSVQFAALYGDVAAREVGYTPLGLSGFAGLELALADYAGTQTNFSGSTVLLP